MKVAKRILKICATLLICYLVLLLLFTPNTFTATRFSWRGEQYHSRFATACDELIAQAHGEDKRLGRAEIASLPAILQDIKPERVWISTNSVLLINGGAMDGIVIYWVADRDNPPQWHLSIKHGDETRSHRVYTRWK